MKKSHILSEGGVLPCSGSASGSGKGRLALLCFPGAVGTLRPPLGKKLFPVSWVGKKKTSRVVGNVSSFFPNFNFYKLECTGGKSEKEIFFFK